MIFDRNKKKEVIALLGAGSMGTAIVRRQKGPAGRYQRKEPGTGLSGFPLQRL